MPRISEELSYYVILKMKEEVNQKKVTRDLYKSRCTVRKIWLNILETGTVSIIKQKRKKMGRLCLLSERSHRDLIILAKKFPFCGQLQLLEDSKFYPSMSRSTIQRYLRKSGFFGSKAAIKPLCRDVRCRDETQHLYDLPILDASAAIHCLILIVAGSIHWNKLFC